MSVNYRHAYFTVCSLKLYLIFRIVIIAIQQYVNCELPDIQAGFKKDRGMRDQIANIHWIIEKAREFQKNIYLCFTDYAKAFDCVDHNKLWKNVISSRKASLTPPFSLKMVGSQTKVMARKYKEIDNCEKYCRDRIGRTCSCEISIKINQRLYRINSELENKNW